MPSFEPAILCRGQPVAPGTLTAPVLPVLSVVLVRSPSSSHRTSSYSYAAFFFVFLILTCKHAAYDRAYACILRTGIIYQYLARTLGCSGRNTRVE